MSDDEQTAVVRLTTQPRPALPRPLVIALIEDERDLGLLRVGATLGDVIALSTRAPTASTVAPRALAHGATRAIDIANIALADVDYLAVAHVLACAVRHLCASAPAIVLAGDRGRSAVGPAVAERLAVPHLGAVLGVTVERDQLLIERLSFTNGQRYRGAPPVLLACVVPAPPESTANNGEVETIGLDILQITMPELRYRRRFRPEPGPALSRRASLLPDIERLGERLSRDGVWPAKR